jgi:sigma-B regulation protein RsbU (phosphoserine phosphatase)
MLKFSLNRPVSEIPVEVPLSASLIVVDPGGARSRVRIDPLPFLIGRQPGNNLVLRDARISRTHARVVAEGGGYWIEDLDSRNGVFVNDERVSKRRLNALDRIDFGVPDSYTLTYTEDDSGIHRLASQFAAPPAPGGDLARLRAVVELARALETSVSTADLLAALVDAALAITGAERGFLLLSKGAELEFRIARDSRGAALTADDLRVPMGLIRSALAERRELLSMSFDPNSPESSLPSRTIADLELRSVVCVPLVRIRAALASGAAKPSPAEETLGVLYMDTRAGSADLAAGNRDLLHTLALEASTVLENARLLEGERARQRMEEELRIARAIQESLLPRHLPSTGWLHAAGRSVPARQVGGDYFDLREAESSSWALVIADVSGKGISSALLASLIQGVFLAAPYTSLVAEDAMARLNQFLVERAEGEKYATVFYGTLYRTGLLRYVNAGHCAPLLVRAAGGITTLGPTGLPVGMLEEAAYAAQEVQLSPGDMLVLYTDGLSEAQNLEGESFGGARLREAVLAGAHAGCQALYEAVDGAVWAFTEGTVQKDDMTIMAVEFCPE